MYTPRRMVTYKEQTAFVIAADEQRVTARDLTDTIHVVQEFIKETKGEHFTQYDDSFTVEVVDDGILLIVERSVTPEQIASTLNEKKVDAFIPTTFPEVSEAASASQSDDSDEEFVKHHGGRILQWLKTRAVGESGMTLDDIVNFLSVRKDAPVNRSVVADYMDRLQAEKYVVIRADGETMVREYYIAPKGFQWVLEYGQSVSTPDPLR